MAHSYKKHSIKSFAGFWILLIAAVVLEGTACIQYFYSRAGIQREARMRAKAELRCAELEINVVTSQVEMAVKNLAMMAEYYIDQPDSMPIITGLIVRRTTDVMSAGVAFIPDYYPRKGKWYEICSRETEPGDKKHILTTQIGSETHDYFQYEWYRNGISIDSCWWCEPYYDNAGAMTMIVSCSYPIRNRMGEIVGVACADVSLSHLKHISEYLQIYKDSYYSIASSTGIAIVPQPDTIPGRKYMIFDQEIDATGWHLSIIIPEDVLYADLRRVGMVITILMIIGLLLLIFIIYRSASDIRKLMKANSLQERMLGELEIARTIQMSMLPTTFPPYTGRPDLSMYGVIIPAKEVGGDLYDFYIRDERLFFCIGDVSGKGVPASLVMATTRSLFRSLSMHEADVAALAAQMNNAMAETNEQNMFVTLFLGVMDLQSGELHYCNAGHNAPVLVQRLINAEAKEIKVEMLPTIPNLPMGILSGYAYTPQTTTIHRGDALFLYTDGLTEAENSRHEQFGEERMRENLNRFEKGLLIPSDPHAAQMQVDSMLHDVRSFVGIAEQSDDLTMLVIRYLPDKNNAARTDEKSTRHSIVMRNDIQQIPTLAEWVESLNIPPALNMTINLALEEAVTNVMLYAYPDSAGKVLIEAEKTCNKITFVISDNGIPFDPTNQPPADISLSAEEREIGGLGIHLVRQIMDEIAYERKDEKNILTLVKNL